MKLRTLLSFVAALYSLVEAHNSSQVYSSWPIYDSQGNYLPFPWYGQQQQQQQHQQPQYGSEQPVLGTQSQHFQPLSNEFYQEQQQQLQRLISLQWELERIRLLLENELFCMMFDWEMQRLHSPPYLQQYHTQQQQHCMQMLQQHEQLQQQPIFHFFYQQHIPEQQMQSELLQHQENRQLPQHRQLQQQQLPPFQRRRWQLHIPPQLARHPQSYFSQSQQQLFLHQQRQQLQPQLSERQQQEQHSIRLLPQQLRRTPPRFSRTTATPSFYQ